MATTIQSAFQQLKQNLEITGLQVETVSTRQNNVRDVLARDLIVNDSFLTGSYRRNTIIAPLSEADIDIFILLDPKYFYHYDNGQNGGQAGLLDLIKRTLRKTYTRTPDISRDGQAVTIKFEDFAVDIVPGFTRKGGGYLIPNSISQTWISTDPKKHVELFISANATHAGNFIPLVKMIKAWNKENGEHFHSFHLEVLALQIFNNVTISDFPSGMRYFFNKAMMQVTLQNLDPAGYGGDIGAYINSQEKINTAVGKFQVAYERALKAESYANQGNIKTAMQFWSTIFDDYFPAYV